MHPDIVGQANDLNRLDAMIGGRPPDALEQFFADAAAPITVLDRERSLGVNVAPERRLLAPDRLVGAQFGRADHLAVDKGPINEIALAEAVFGILGKKIVRHAASEALMAAARVKSQQMIAE